MEELKYFILGEIVLYNVFYEVFTVCTSIIAEDPSGMIVAIFVLTNQPYFGKKHMSKQ